MKSGIDRALAEAELKLFAAKIWHTAARRIGDEAAVQEFLDYRARCLRNTTRLWNTVFLGFVTGEYVNAPEDEKPRRLLELARHLCLSDEVWTQSKQRFAEFCKKHPGPSEDAWYLECGVEDLILT